ncbi:ABC transporter permease [Leucothrix pacifica]|uniref:Polyamine ABC transporter permease n=1 Tax=Leucothrix pacifica TaxID=1247513 RepID=A0A317CJT9_9GAMM|nr:ABC transporter permease [Leucothrix pacifica]PWQ98855.1 polyamine ABC transporter permease [Leucothrix pacifica]
MTTQKPFITRPGTIALYVATAIVFLLTFSPAVALAFILVFGIPLFFMHEMPAYTTTGEKIGKYIFLTICTMIFIFLITPILVIIPLSFNAEPYFTFTEGMLSLDPSAYSLRWYKDIVQFGMLDPTGTENWWSDMWNNSTWVRAARNSFFIALVSTILATAFGTLAALGLSRPEMPYRSAITSLLISPMIVPLVITATGMFFFYSQKNLFPFYPDGLSKTYLGIILAHATLGVPFVIITVTATLSGFDRSLIRASQGLGASGTTTFFKVIMPLILPGMISGALFAFITSLDEVVAVIFLADVDQRTIPRQMFSGIREQISPTILAVATLLVVMSIALLTALELLRRRSERLRGLAPS